MHSALYIEEILENILRFLNPTGPQHDSASIAAVSETCRDLKEPALDALWRDLYTLDGVVRLLPEDAWGTNEAHWSSDQGSKLTLLRPLQPEDWADAAKFLSRVKSLTLGPDSAPSESLFEAIASSFPSPTKIFPNLARLHWDEFTENTDHKRSFSRYIPLFLSPSLVALDLEGVPAEFAERLLGEDLSHMKHFEVTFGESRFHAPEIISVSTELVLRLVPACARTVTVDCVDQTGLRHLASMRNLAALALWRPQDGDFATASNPSRASSDPISFPGLTSLHLANTTFEFGCEFFAFVGPLRLHDFRLGMCEVAEKTALDHLVQMVAANLDPDTLRELIIGAPSISDGMYAPTAGANLSLYAFDETTLQPLSRFHNLTRLELQSCVGPRISDSVLRRLAVPWPWPALRILRLHAGSPMQIAPRITLKGLTTLAEHCPLLEELAVPMNALGARMQTPDLSANSASPPSQTEERFQHLALSRLDLGASSIAKPAMLGVGVYLSRLFPNLDASRLSKVHEIPPAKLPAFRSRHAGHRPTPPSPHLDLPALPLPSSEAALSQDTSCRATPLSSPEPPAAQAVCRRATRRLKWATRGHSDPYHGAMGAAHSRRPSQPSPRDALDAAPHGLANASYWSSRPPSPGEGAHPASPDHDPLIRPVSPHSPPRGHTHS
ncbi:hypothetical protein MKEN_00190500 [Mycena kentingensis (nom. inval.)]|nr:hypothetical protein MKEN_00190500 [Mycena kentingensis (nom. inval.)]